MKLYRKHLRKKHIVLGFFVLFSLLTLWGAGETLSPEPFHSVEVGVATLSPHDTEGGLAVPASCPAFAHTIGECDPSLNLTVDGQDAITVDVNEPFTLAWQNNPNTYACEPSGSWSGAPRLPNQTQQLSESVSGIYTYEMRCRGASLAEALNYIDTAPTETYFHSPEYTDPSRGYNIPNDPYGLTIKSGHRAYLERIYSYPHSILAADVAIGTDNIPRIAYYDYTLGAILLYTCSDASCSGAGTHQNLGELPSVPRNLLFIKWPYGSSVELTLLAGNIPEIMVYSGDEDATPYIGKNRITCSNAECSSHTTTLLSATQTEIVNHRNAHAPNPSSTTGTAIRSAGISLTGMTSESVGSQFGYPPYDLSYARRNGGTGEMVAVYPVISPGGGGEGFFFLDNYQGLQPIPVLMLKCATGGCADKIITPPIPTWGLNYTPTESVQVTVNAVTLPQAPPPPIIQTYSCPLPGTQGTIAWHAASGPVQPTYYLFRIDDMGTLGAPNAWNGCTPANPGDICSENLPGGPFTGTSYNFAATGGHTYNWWVHACNAVGCSAAASPYPPNTLYCPTPEQVTAVLKVSPTPTGVSDSVATVDYNRPAYLTWISSLAPGAGTCTITRTPSNGSPININFGNAVSDNARSTGNLTQERYTYRLICRDTTTGVESRPSDVTVYVRPLVNLLVSNTATPPRVWTQGPITINSGTRAWLNWSANNVRLNNPCLITRTPSGGPAFSTGPGSSDLIRGETTGILTSSNYTYDIECFNNNPAGSNSWSDSVEINVTQSSFSVACSPSSSNIRAGENITFTATPSGNYSGTPFYIWGGTGATCGLDGSPNDETEECTFDTPGSYSMSVGGTAIPGGADTDTCNITVAPSGGGTFSSSCFGLAFGNNIRWATSGSGLGSYTTDWTFTPAGGPSQNQTASGLQTTSGPYDPDTYVGATVTVTNTTTGATGTASCNYTTPSSSGPVCGDGNIDAGETCDDGNTTDGDGCSAVCQIESGGGRCDTDSICEPLRGETPLNCTDCKKDVEEE